MKINKVTAVPLVTQDPFFSVWSAYDHLNDGVTTHWCGVKQPLQGYLKVDGEVFCFLGEPDFCEIIEQKETFVTATKTTAIFENEKVVLEVSFLSPLLLSNLPVTARPVTYIDFKVTKKVPIEQLEITVTVSADMVRNDGGRVGGGFHSIERVNIKFHPQRPRFHPCKQVKSLDLNMQYAMMGKIDQKPLSESGDTITINWGYVYLATTQGQVGYEADKERIFVKLEGKETEKGQILIAYDDLVSINYFGDFVKGLWTEYDKNIVGAMGNAIKEYAELAEQCKKIDEEVENRAREIGGENYALLCNLSYRQAISAHKLIKDKEGEIVFLSKENKSNGCIGTADVSYPSMPLFLLYNVECVKGMIRPIMDFAACDVWEYDFAPHDVGRYPYAWGQVYGADFNSSAFTLTDDSRRMDKTVYPPYYMLPKGSNIYDFERQMPVEECGNMIIMIANVCKLENSPQFALKYRDTLEKWVKYLIKFGANPGNQLCTDDFAGHLAQNINLSFKAIMGIEGYSLLMELMGEVEAAKEYHKIAKEMAVDCENRAKTKQYTKLTYDNEESWSLKYNIIWDKIWNSNLFSQELFKNEIACYVEKSNEFGVPLDSRADYTKSDWILWCVAMAESKEEKEALLNPVAEFLKNSSTRVPFSDWYDTKTGQYRSFIARSVQGGIFMPFLTHEM